MSTEEPVGLNCPGCRRYAYARIGTRQAMCGNPDCKILFWDPGSTMDELLDDYHEIDLTGWGLNP